MHLQRHEVVKSFACDEYQKCFFTAGALTRQKRGHSDVKNFCYGFCGRDFI